MRARASSLSRSFSLARGIFSVSRVSLNGLKKRETARSLKQNQRETPLRR